MDMPRPTPTSRTTLNTSSWHLPSSATSLSLSSSCVSDNSCRMPTFRHLSDLVFITSASGSLQAVNDSHILNTWCIINATGYKHTHTTTQTHVHRNGHHTHTHVHRNGHRAKPLGHIHQRYWYNLHVFIQNEHDKYSFIRIWLVLIQGEVLKVGFQFWSVTHQSSSTSFVLIFCLIRISFISINFTIASHWSHSTYMLTINLCYIVHW